MFYQSILVSDSHSNDLVARQMGLLFSSLFTPLLCYSPFLSHCLTCHIVPPKTPIHTAVTVLLSDLLTSVVNTLAIGR